MAVNGRFDRDDPAWSEPDLIANSFGHGPSATPVQVLTAVCAIANEGKLLQPYVVLSNRDLPYGAEVTRH